MTPRLILPAQVFRTERSALFELRDAWVPYMGLDWLLTQ